MQTDTVGIRRWCHSRGKGSAPRAVVAHRLVAGVLAVVAALLMAVVTLPPSEAQEIRFAKPADCVLGETCFIQNYVDHDPGPGASDLTCGVRTYDHHTGTDIRILDLAAMRRGVAVRAAADGRVRRIRNDVADVSFRDIGTDAIRGKSCGNAAVLDHGAGWSTIYCHMHRGSVVVQPGQIVKAGQQLGLVGLSGRTEFPHLHFEVRHGRRLVDPFAGPAAVGAGGVNSCGAPSHSLWRNPVAVGLIYVPAAVIGAGFAATVPTAKSLADGIHRSSTLPPDSPSLLFWVRVIGVLPGDVQALQVVRPDGKVLARSRPKNVDRAKALYWGYVGKRRRDAPWPAGVYRGEYRLARDGRQLLQKVVTLRIE